MGTLTGTVTDSAGAVVGTISQQVTLPSRRTEHAEVLHLVLGPLDLNLLGLVVHLNQVVLDITAQSGPGNLLGNLLCAGRQPAEQQRDGRGSCEPAEPRALRSSRSRGHDELTAGSILAAATLAAVSRASMTAAPRRRVIAKSC